MALMLVAVDGKYKGWAWEIPSKGLLLGRGPENDIVVVDPLVSRRHCRLTRVSGTEVRLEDLGSMNPLLVNGAPLREGSLKLGDELAAGKLRFLIAEDALAAMQGLVTHAAPPAPLAVAGTATHDQAISLGVGGPAGTAQSAPRDVSDAAFLNESMRVFGACSTLRELGAAIEKRLYDRFNPASMWFALVGSNGALSFLRDGSKYDAPAKLIDKALRTRSGVLAPSQDPSRRTGFVLVAPVMRNGVPEALIALQTASAAAPCNEDELGLFILFAQVLAPFVHFVLTNERLQYETERLRAAAGESTMLVGDSPAIHHIREQIVQAADAGQGILVTGESGVGKQLVARLIHARSARARVPLVPVHCAAIPSDTFEREWCGYKKGAFADASDDREGCFAKAHLGALLLDEPAALSQHNQARVLEILDKGAVRRIGGRSERRVNVQVISTSSYDLGEAVRRGTFREDLYQRLGSFEIKIPPLRERPEDIPLLARHFFEQSKHLARRPLIGFAKEMPEHLKSRPWPENARELRDAVIRAIRNAESEFIDVSGE